MDDDDWVAGYRGGLHWAWAHPQWRPRAHDWQFSPAPGLPAGASSTFAAGWVQGLRQRH